MKQWIIRIAIGLFGLILLAVAGFFGVCYYQRWAHAKAQKERAATLRSYYPSKARIFIRSIRLIKKQTITTAFTATGFWEAAKSLVTTKGHVNSFALSGDFRLPF